MGDSCNQKMQFLMKMQTSVKLGDFSSPAMQPFHKHFVHCVQQASLGKISMEQTYSLLYFLFTAHGRAYVIKAKSLLKSTTRIRSDGSVGKSDCSSNLAIQSKPILEGKNIPPLAHYDSKCTLGQHVCEHTRIHTHTIIHIHTNYKSYHLRKKLLMFKFLSYILCHFYTQCSVHNFNFGGKFSNFSSRENILIFSPIIVTSLFPGS